MKYIFKTSKDDPTFLSKVNISAESSEKEDLSVMTIPEGIKEIGKFAIQNNYVKTVILPSTLEVIHRDSFFDCQILENIINIDNVKTIEDAAFEYTPNVKISDLILKQRIVSSCEYRKKASNSTKNHSLAKNHSLNNDAGWFFIGFLFGIIGATLVACMSEDSNKKYLAGVGCLSWIIVSVLISIIILCIKLI